MASLELSTSSLACECIEGLLGAIIVPIPNPIRAMVKAINVKMAANFF